MTDDEKSAWVEKAIKNGAKLLPDSIRDIDAVFCGCGNPEDAWQWVLDYLEKKEGNLYFGPESGAEQIAFYLMDHLGLTEHGTGINGAWLTDKGREALLFLREFGVNWDEGREWVDSNGISYGHA